MAFLGPEMTSHCPLEGYATLNMAMLVARVGIPLRPFSHSVLDLYGLSSMQLFLRAWYMLVRFLFLFLDHGADIPSLRF